MERPMTAIGTLPIAILFALTLKNRRSHIYTQLRGNAGLCEHLHTHVMWRRKPCKNDVATSAEWYAKARPNTQRLRRAVACDRHRHTIFRPARIPWTRLCPHSNDSDPAISRSPALLRRYHCANSVIRFFLSLYYYIYTLSCVCVSVRACESGHPSECRRSYTDREQILDRSAKKKKSRPTHEWRF